MIAKMIAGVTRVCGKAQGYMGLPIRDETVVDPVAGEVPCMATAWEPTPEELSLLVAGAPVIVRIVGTRPPPMIVMVGEVPA